MMVDSDLNLITKGSLKLGLSDEATALSIGITASELNKTKSDSAILQRKAVQKTLLEVQVYKEVCALVGHSEKLMQHWMVTPNKHFNSSISYLDKFMRK
ncbi:hypothetical protein [Pleionea litopenaei]|uniref:Uncharacterized protein n=1 Tax=Pleionea litopenaei TaxID=3070815 RepID=A0AA51RUE4_9GAMM|nr:hypothetical protein [Pleionea sp. HL-JVS1]WMS87891.1 hypothetical protein Q9312_02965 [Pleionea sp. HL-JVS1]